MPHNPACHKCILHKGVNSVCVWGQGPPRAAIMLIGEAPGEVEDRDNEPFVGSAGSVLDGLFADVGLKRSDVYISNVVKCRPPGNRDPLPAELSACWSYLAEELASVKPKVIICAGRYPLQVLTGHKTIKDERGKPVPASRHVRIGDAAILATYHPAAALHNRRQDSSGNSLILSAIREDLELAKALVGLTAQVLPEHERIMLLPREYGTKADDVIAALMRLRAVKTIAVDCEWTAGKDEDEGMFWPWTPGAELFSLSLSGRADGKVVSIGVAWPQEPRAQRALQAFMTARKLVFHNAMADLIWLVATGILTLVDLIKLARSGALDDTQFMGYLLNEEQRLNLDRLAPLVAGIPPGWKRGPWTRRPASERGWTHGYDGILPYNCFPADTKVAAPSGVRKAFQRSYSGPLTKITTTRGYQLSGTPNHPVLTENGWVALGLLKIGDHVISRSSSKDVLCGNSHENDRDALIGEVFNLSQMSGITRRVAGVGSQFHGDGQNSNVDVVALDGLLENWLQSAFSQPIGKYNFSASDEMFQRLSLERGLYQSARFGGSSFNRPSSRRSPGRSLFGSVWSFTEKQLRFAEGTHYAASANKPITKCAWINSSQTSCYVSDAFSSDVAFDEIVNIERNAFSGHVYNLETNDHTYLANNIIVSNCDDTYATLLLREGLVRQVAAKAKDERANIGKAYRKLLIPALPTFVSMALNGAPIDSAELDKAIEEQQATAERVAVEAASDMNRPVAVAKQILASHDKIRRHLVEAYGLRLSDARADTLEPYARQFPVVKARTDYTHAKKMTGTYLEPWQTLVRRQGDNALHSIYRLDRTRTGRTSANTEIGGSIQLAPRAEWFRRMIGTVEDDWELISADYSQAEIRTTAWLAPERTMRKLYNEGADLHLRTAMEVAQNETVRTAQMLLLRAGLPASRASSEILSEVFRITDGDRETQEKGKVLSTGGNVWSDKESWRRLWRQSKWREEPVLEGRHISAFLHDSPEGLLREVWSEDKSSSSPQRPQSSEQWRIEYQDAVSLVSRAGARVLQAFPEWKEHRQRAKGVGFGFLFGMQAEKFQQYAYTSYGVIFTLDESIEAREKFFNLYSDLAAWHERAKQQMFSGEPISMPFGRYRRGATDVTQYINTPIQTTANDLAIFATSKIGDKVLAEYSGVAKMAGYVHDSIFVKVRRDYTDEIKALVKDMMEHPPLDEVGIEIPVPLVADVKVGRNWADAK